MYAVIRDTGKEYKVTEGQVIQVDKKQLEKGQAIEFDEVLLYSGEDGVKAGQPTIEGAKVTGEVLGETKSSRTVTLKFRRRKDSRTKKGHRQTYTSVRITSIQKP